ncbi:MAG TPA: DUF4097 family beta strand repeat-containing protein [Pyrinomonadaceae bacterium]|nr:DUF4097 family beta strand repeat-containing protein [Pyrinomonadaceae bacterium]
MKKKTLTALILAAAVLHGAGTPAHWQARAQTVVGSSKPGAQEGSGSVSINNQAGRVQIKLERGSRVAISNRYGRITITGSDGDTVEATATSERGAEAVQVEMTADPDAGRNVLVLNVPGRPGQRMPYINVNPNFDFKPYIFTTPNPTPNPAPTPNPNPNPPDNPNPAPQAQGSTPPAARAKPAKPARVRPQTDDDNDGQVIIVPVPDPAEVAAAVAAAPPASAVVAQPRQQSAAAKLAAARAAADANKTRGVGGGIGVGGSEGTGGISLHVRLPRYALLDAIEVRHGDVHVSDIDGPVSISGGTSNITVNRVGALEVRARSGNINVDGVEGLVYIVATSGKIVVRRTNGDVRATSINGDINIQCVRGRVDASNARGGIVLSAVEGDVEASTTDADINFTGAIRREGRYRLKSMEGRVIMAIPESSPGFTAILASYNKDVITNFPVSNEVLAGGSTRVNRRVEVRQGDGQAQITLDSFGQPVYLTKLPAGSLNACK